MLNINEVRYEFGLSTAKNLPMMMARTRAHTGICVGQTSIAMTPKMNMERKMTAYHQSGTKLRNVSTSSTTSGNAQYLVCISTSAEHVYQAAHA